MFKAVKLLCINYNGGYMSLNICPNPHRMYNARNEPNVDCGLINSNKCSTLRPDFSSRGLGGGGEWWRGKEREDMVTNLKRL